MAEILNSVKRNELLKRWTEIINDTDISIISSIFKYYHVKKFIFDDEEHFGSSYFNKLKNLIYRNISVTEDLLINVINEYPGDLLIALKLNEQLHSLFNMDSMFMLSEISYLEEFNKSLRMGETEGFKIFTYTLGPGISITEYGETFENEPAEEVKLFVPVGYYQLMSWRKELAKEISLAIKQLFNTYLKTLTEENLKIWETSTPAKTEKEKIEQNHVSGLAVYLKPEFYKVIPGLIDEYNASDTRAFYALFILNDKQMLSEDIKTLPKAAAKLYSALEQSFSRSKGDLATIQTFRKWLVDYKVYEPKQKDNNVLKFENFNLEKNKVEYIIAKVEFL